MKQPQFPSYFSDADSDFSQAEFVIFGVCYDQTSSFRSGSTKGPDAIRHASWNLESYNLINDVDFLEIPVHDYGNIDKISHVNPEEMIAKVSNFSQVLMKNKKFPILIGGEHSITAGIIPSLPLDTYILVFDAHLDYRDIFENESYNHACTIKRITDYMPPEHVMVLGVRSAEKNEFTQAKKDNLNIIKATTIQQKGISLVMGDLINQIGKNNIYLSIDIDVIDPGFAPGTGTPEPFGLNPLDILTVFDQIKDCLIGFDIMEVNPLFDHGQTAMLAAKYVRYGIESVYKHNKI